MARCKLCRSVKRKEWRETSPTYRQAQSAHKQNWDLRQFGLTAEVYDALLAAQGGVCAICRQSCITGRRLAVDHDHATGKVRALLCAPCNMDLGAYENIHEKAEIYLAQYGDGNPLLPDGMGCGRIDPPERPRPASTKMADSQIRDIRERYAGGGVSQRTLAAEYGISQINVSRIIRGELWKDVAHV